MSAGRKSKRGHKRRARRVEARPDTLRVAMMGVAFLSKDDQAAKVKPVADAVLALSQGKGTAQDWSAIFDALNMMVTFDTMPTVLRGARGYIDVMHNVITEILERAQEGKRALYPAELVELRAFAALWAEILSMVTNREFAHCESKTRESLKQRILKGEGVTVVGFE